MIMIEGINWKQERKKRERMLHANSSVLPYVKRAEIVLIPQINLIITASTQELNALCTIYHHNCNVTIPIYMCKHL